MKKLLIIALGASALLVGCDGPRNQRPEDLPYAWTRHGFGAHTKVIQIEGHKYILASLDRGGSIIHAASCECQKR